MKPNKREVILAFDKETVRNLDKDGRLFVERSHISKAGVNPYWGREIVNWEELGLDPDRVYNVFRPPEELSKGAQTFKNLPILLVHSHHTAENPQKEKIIGAIGSNPIFDGEYLDNSLGFWDAEYIDKIDSGEQRELSSSYRYVPVLENGSYNGSPYDIRMTQIEGNHVALVVEGRAGPDVLVADSKLPPPQQVRTVKLNPKQLAALKARMPKVKAAMDEGLDTESAQSAMQEALDEMASLGEQQDKAAKDAENGEITELLKKLLARMEGGGGANDETPEEKAAKDEAAARAAEAKKADEAKNAGAMDAKIKTAAEEAATAARQSIEGRFRAAQKVEPITGRIDAMAFDSAEAIYAHALKVGGMEPEKHDKAAYSGIVDVLITAKQTPAPRTAQDAATVDELHKLFPALANIKQV